VGRGLYFLHPMIGRRHVGGGRSGRHFINRSFPFLHRSTRAQVAGRRQCLHASTRAKYVLSRSQRPFPPPPPSNEVIPDRTCVFAYFLLLSPEPPSRTRGRTGSRPPGPPPTRRRSAPGVRIFRTASPRLPPLPRYRRPRPRTASPLPPPVDKQEEGRQRVSQSFSEIDKQTGRQAGRHFATAVPRSPSPAS